MGFWSKLFGGTGTAPEDPFQAQPLSEWAPNAVALEGHFAGVQPTDLLVIACHDGRSYSVSVEGASIQDIDDPRFDICKTLAALEAEDMLGKLGVRH